MEHTKSVTVRVFHHGPAVSVTVPVSPAPTYEELVARFADALSLSVHLVSGSEYTKDGHAYRENGNGSDIDGFLCESSRASRCPTLTFAIWQSCFSRLLQSPVSPAFYFHVGSLAAPPLSTSNLLSHGLSSFAFSPSSASASGTLPLFSPASTVRDDPLT
ncbi:hypothetical protein JCM10207_006793 [Rhodosporidiobolus poonsookiae]